MMSKPTLLFFYLVAGSFAFPDYRYHPGHTRSDLGPKPDCFIDLDLLSQFVITKNSSVEEFILCPNTSFRVGKLLPNTVGYSDGGPPLTLRENSHFKCGLNGKSTNNCTLYGGHIQISSPRSSKNTNVRLEGLTLENASNTGAMLGSEGDILFKDCVFRKHRNYGAVRLMFFPFLARHLQQLAGKVERLSHAQQLTPIEFFYSHLQEHPEMKALVESDIRNLQEQVQPRQVVTFEDCLFEFNTYGGRNSTNWAWTVIGAETAFNDVIIKNSIFENNGVGDTGTDVVASISAVKIPTGASVDISDTCFINNDFVGLGTVEVQDAASVRSLTGNTGENRLDTNCEFVSIGNGTSDNCLPYDAFRCKSRPNYIPSTPLPTSSPIAQLPPTLAPTARPAVPPSLSPNSPPTSSPSNEPSQRLGIVLTLHPTNLSPNSSSGETLARLAAVPFAIAVAILF